MSTLILDFIDPNRFDSFKRTMRKSVIYEIFDSPIDFTKRCIKISGYFWPTQSSCPDPQKMTIFFCQFTFIFTPRNALRNDSVNRTINSTHKNHGTSISVDVQTFGPFLMYRKSDNFDRNEDIFPCYSCVVRSQLLFFRPLSIYFRLFLPFENRYLVIGGFIE